MAEYIELKKTGDKNFVIEGKVPGAIKGKNKAEALNQLDQVGFKVVSDNGDSVTLKRD